MKKLIIWTIVLLTLIMSAYATIDDAYLWYSMDSDKRDGTQAQNWTNTDDLKLETRNSATYTTDGVFNDAVNLTATNSRLVNVSMDGSKWRTVSFWTKREEAGYVFTITTGNGENTDRWTLESTGANNYAILLRKGSSNVVSTSCGFSGMTDWHHVVLTSNPTQLFINGTNQTGCYVASAEQPTAVMDEFTLAELWITDAGDHYKGYFDEFAVYSRLLTASEISDLYTTGNPYDVAPGNNDTLNLTGFYPPDNYEQNSTILELNTTVSSHGSYNCTLYVNGTINQTNDYLSSGVARFNLTFNLPETNQISVKIGCDDGQSPENTTESSVDIDTATSFEGINIPINDFNFSSSTFVNVSTFRYNTTDTEDLAVFLSLNIEKTDFATTTNTIFVDVVDDGVSLGEKQIRQVTGIGNVGATGSMWSIPRHPAGNHTITLQIRRESTNNKGTISASNIDFALTTSRSSDKTFMNANVTEFNGTFSSTSYEDIYNLTASSEDWPIFSVGISSMEATGSDTIVRRIHNGDMGQFTSSRDVGTSLGTMMIIGNLTPSDYVIHQGKTFNGETVSYFDDVGFIEMGDAFRPVNHIITKKTGNYTDSINVFPNQVLYSETFTPESDALLIMYQGAYNFTSATPTYTLTVENHPECSTQKERTFTGSRGNVFFVRHCNNVTPETPLNINLSISTGVATESALYDDAFFIASSTTLDVSVEPDTTSPVINVTYPDKSFNVSTGQVNGTCTDNSVIIEITVNDTDFIYNGGLNAWSFNYTGVDSKEKSLNFTCTDLSGNTDSILIDVYVDVVRPSCLTFGSETVDYGDNYTWNVACTDDQELFSFNSSCTNGYNFSVTGINATGYNFTETVTNLTTDFTCTHIICDGHTKQDVRKELNAFTVTKEDYKIKLKNLKVLELDTDMSTTMSRLNLNFEDIDRVKFEFEVDDKQTAPYNFVVHVNPNGTLRKMSSGIYQGHYILYDRYWLDFESDDVYDFEEYQLSENHWVIRFKSDKKKVKFKSIGIINCNTYTQNFNVGNPPSTLGIFNTAECPDDNLQQTAIYLFLIVLCFGLMLLSGIFRLNWLGFLGAFLLMFLTFSMFGCSLAGGWVLMLISISMMAYFGFVAK